MRHIRCSFSRLMVFLLLFCVSVFLVHSVLASPAPAAAPAPGHAHQNVERNLKESAGSAGGNTVRAGEGGGKKEKDFDEQLENVRFDEGKAGSDQGMAGSDQGGAGTGGEEEIPPVLTRERTGEFVEILRDKPRLSLSSSATLERLLQEEREKHGVAEPAQPPLEVGLEA